MWLIDLSEGLSEICLFRALLFAADGLKDDCIAAIASHGEVEAKAASLIGEGEPDDMKALKKFCNEQNDVRISECNETVSIISCLQKHDAIDYFSYFLYVCCSVFIDIIRRHMLLDATVPRIGAATPSDVVSLFENESIILSARGKVYSDIQALFALLLTPYSPETFCNDVSIVDVDNPFDKSEKLRLFRCAYENDIHGDIVAVLEANIDDMNPELLADTARELMTDGALDVVLTPVIMKKGRPGIVVQVICRCMDERRFADRLFEWTTTFGIRRMKTRRFILRRETRKVDTPYGTVTVKIGIRGKKVMTAAPEYEEVAALSRKNGIPLKFIYNEIIALAREISV